MTRRSKPRAHLQVGHPPPPGVEHAVDCECDQHGRRVRPGPKPRAGEPSSETLRFRCTTREAKQIYDACSERGRDLSDVARELLLAWARTET